MYTVTQSYLDAVRAQSRSERLTGTLRYADGEEIPLTESVIGMGSVSINKSCVEGEALQFGSAILGQLKISLRTKESRYRFYDSKIELLYGILTDDGWFDIPLGCYTVGESDRKTSVVQLVAYDNLLLLDKGYGATVLYGTPYEIATMICENCGVALGMTEEECKALPNGEELIQIDETSGCGTYRDAMKILAQMTGTFVVADNVGAIALRQFKTEAVTKLDKTHRYSMTAADYICSYVGLTIKSSTREFTSYDPDIVSGLEMMINDAPAWDYGLDETLQLRADTLRSALTKIFYTPSTISMPGDPAIECGDLLELVTDDGRVNTLVTETTWKFRNKMSVKSAGANPYLKAAKSKKTQVVRELEATAEENKLIFYSFTNQNALQVSGEEPVEVSQVTFVTTDATSAMFVAQLPVIVEVEDSVTTESTETETEYEVKASSEIFDADGNPITLSVLIPRTDTTNTVNPGRVDLQIEYYLRGTLLNYELIAQLPSGRHILALFYAFDNLDGKTDYQWQVKLRLVGGSGTVTVPKRAFRATVTGQGLAGTSKWDGRINIDESTTPFTALHNYRLRAFEEETAHSTAIPDASAISETAAPFALRMCTVLGDNYVTDVAFGHIEKDAGDSTAPFALRSYALMSDNYVDEITVENNNVEEE